MSLLLLCSVGELSIAISFSVCLSVHEHISGTAGPISMKFVMQIPRGYGSFFLWWRYDTLCTSGIWFYGWCQCSSGSYGDVWKPEPLTYYRERRCDTGAEADVCECFVLSCVILCSVDGMLIMCARPPPPQDFISIFQKFKLAINLLVSFSSARLTCHITINRQMMSPMSKICRKHLFISGID